MAGIDLIPAMDCEIAAINISINDQAVGIVKSDDSLPAFAWHRDSYPFVCVTILSDCTGMTGGETALKTASGDIMKVRGPAMVSSSPKDMFLPLTCIQGTAVVMQGRYIEHQALKAFGGRERISMVTSFEPSHRISETRPFSLASGLSATYPSFIPSTLSTDLKSWRRESGSSCNRNGNGKRQIEPSKLWKCGTF